MINDVPQGPGDRRAHGPRTTASLVAALAAPLLAAAIAGCGGGSGASSTSIATSAGTPTPPSTQSSTPGSGGAATVGNGTQRPGQTPKQTVNAVLTSVGPANCGASTEVSAGNVTAHYVQAAYGDVKGCIRSQAQRAAAKSLRSYQEQVNGDKATVEVRPVGGIYDGEKLTVSLVKEDGGWKVDELKSNAPVGP